MDFSQISNERYILFSLLDSLLSLASKDVLTGSLAQSVQEIYLTKVHWPLQWPAMGLQSFKSTPTVVPFTNHNAGIQ